MRCAYCHNPDTWDAQQGKNITIEEVWEQFERNQSFIKRTASPSPVAKH